MDIKTLTNAARDEYRAMQTVLKAYVTAQDKAELTGVKAVAYTAAFAATARTQHGAKGADIQAAIIPGKVKESRLKNVWYAAKPLALRLEKDRANALLTMHEALAYMDNVEAERVAANAAAYDTFTGVDPADFKAVSEALYGFLTSFGFTNVQQISEFLRTRNMPKKQTPIERLFSALKNGLTVEGGMTAAKAKELAETIVKTMPLGFRGTFAEAAIVAYDDMSEAAIKAEAKANGTPSVPDEAEAAAEAAIAEAAQQRLAA